MKVGDFVKMYSCQDEADFVDGAFVVDLIERKGIITSLSKEKPSFIQVLWSDGVMEWTSSASVTIVSNLDIS